MAFARPKKREPVGETALLEYAVGALARRMRSVRDLRRLMKARTFPGPEGEAAIDAVVARLTELGYLSDSRYAADFTRSKQENNSQGRRRVGQELMLRGIAPELVEHTLETAYGDVDEMALARQFCARKRLKPPVDARETARLVARLARAGFSSGTIRGVLKRWDASEEILGQLAEEA